MAPSGSSSPTRRVFSRGLMHTPEGIQKAQADFRRIIDRVIEYGGRFYLTYHPWATRDQVETCYPRFSEFLDAKLMHDPECRF